MTCPARWASSPGRRWPWIEHGQQQRSVGPEGFRGLCLNIAALDGGVAFNVIPSQARLAVSVRPAPGATRAA